MRQRKGSGPEGEARVLLGQRGERVPASKGHARPRKQARHAQGVRLDASGWSCQAPQPSWFRHAGCHPQHPTPPAPLPSSSGARGSGAGPACSSPAGRSVFVPPVPFRRGVGGRGSPDSLLPTGGPASAWPADPTGPPRRRDRPRTSHRALGLEWGGSRGRSRRGPGAPRPRP